MLGFEIGFWDSVTFVALFIQGAAFVAVLVLVAALRCAAETPRG